MPETIDFTKDKDTKNTRRYKEIERGDKGPMIGMLYVQKWLLTDLSVDGSLPENIKITLEIL